MEKNAFFYAQTDTFLAGKDPTFDVLISRSRSSSSALPPTVDRPLKEEHERSWGHQSPPPPPDPSRGKVSSVRNSLPRNAPPPSRGGTIYPNNFSGCCPFIERGNLTPRRGGCASRLPPQRPRRRWRLYGGTIQTRCAPRCCSRTAWVHARDGTSFLFFYFCQKFLQHNITAHTRSLSLQPPLSKPASRPPHQHPHHPTSHAARTGWRARARSTPPSAARSPRTDVASNLLRTFATSPTTTRLPCSTQPRRWPRP